MNEQPASDRDDHDPIAEGRGLSRAAVLRAALALPATVLLRCRSDPRALPA